MTDVLWRIGSFSLSEESGQFVLRDGEQFVLSIPANGAFVLVPERGRSWAAEIELPDPFRWGEVLPTGRGGLALRKVLGPSELRAVSSESGCGHLLLIRTIARVRRQDLNRTVIPATVLAWRESGSGMISPAPIDTSLLLEMIWKEMEAAMRMEVSFYVCLPWRHAWGR